MNQKIFVLLGLGALLTSCSGSKEPVAISADISDVASTGMDAGESSGPLADAFHADIEKEGLNQVFFGFDKSSLKAADKEALDAQAKWLLEHSEAFVEVQGYCDRHGPVAYNDALGQRRADAAANYLIDAGVERSRIRLVSFGNRKLLVEGTTDEVDAQNRTAITVVREAPAESPAEVD